MAYVIYQDGKWYDSAALGALTTDSERAAFWENEARASHRRAENLRLLAGPPPTRFGYFVLIVYAITATLVVLIT